MFAKTVRALKIAAIFGLFAANAAAAFAAKPQVPSVSIPLENAFRWTANGVERRGFDAENSANPENDVEKSVFVENFETTPGDRFPRSSVSTETSTRFDAATGLEIRVEKTIYRDFPVVETVVWFENVAETDSPNLRDVLVADVLLPTGGAPNLSSGIGEDPDPTRNYRFETSPLGPGETRSFVPREAYSSFGAFPYFRISGRETSYTLAVGWTGRWTATFDAAADGSGDVRVRVGQFGVDLFLKPGEKIRTPRLTLFEYRTGTDETKIWRDWFRTYILPRENGLVLRPKLALDVFYRGEFYAEITADEQIAAIRKLRELGYPCEALWVDAGWYLRQKTANEPKTDVGRWFLTGDWTPDPARFPNGFRPVVDELKRGDENGGKGGKLVLWFEPERVHRSRVDDAWRSFLVPNCEAVESFRADLTDPKTVEFLSEKIGKTIRDNGVEIYRQDSNGAGPLVFLEALERDDPRFQGRRGYAENLYVRGLYEFWANLKAVNPGLIFDTCASGGRRNDLEILRLGAVPLHYSDVGYFDFVEKQRVHDVLNTWFVYYKNIDPHDFDFEKGEYDVYKTTIDLAPFSTVRPYFLENPSAANRRYVDRYLAVRETLVDGDYYLLNAGFSPNGWAVWQFDDAARRSGCVATVRNAEAEAAFTVRPKALDPTARYRWENLETQTATEISGAELISNGVRVELAPNSAAVFRYEALK